MKTILTGIVFLIFFGSSTFRNEYALLGMEEIKKEEKEKKGRNFLIKDFLLQYK